MQPRATATNPFAGDDSQHFGPSILKMAQRLLYLLLFSGVGGLLVVLALVEELDSQVGPLLVGLVFWGAGGVICLVPLIRDRGLRLSISNHGVRLRQAGEATTVRWAEVRRLQWSSVNGRPHRLQLEKWDGNSLEIPMEAVGSSQEADKAIRRVFGA